MKPSPIQASYGLVDLESKVLAVRILPDLCEKLIKEMDKREKEANRRRSAHQDLLMLRMTARDIKKYQLKKVFERFDIQGVSVNKFTPKQKTRPHFDSRSFGQDVIIIRLDDNPESRLKIKGNRVDELKNFGYWLPMGTVHEITTGKLDRYSLVVWVNKKKEKK